MEDIKIGVVGRITSGRYSGWYTKVEPQKNGEDFIVLIFNIDEGYDNWVANIEDLKKYFQEENWKVEWTDVENEHLIIQKEPDFIAELQFFDIDETLKLMLGKKGVYGTYLLPEGENFEGGTFFRVGLLFYNIDSIAGQKLIEIPIKILDKHPKNISIPIDKEGIKVGDKFTLRRGNIKLTAKGVVKQLLWK